MICKEEKSELIVSRKQRWKANSDLGGYCGSLGDVGDLVRQCRFNCLFVTLIIADGIQGEMGEVDLYFSKGMGAQI